MRYVRFMSIEELGKYLRGEKLKNHTVWKDRGGKTDSVGFCFFDDSEPPQKRLEYYSRGITCSTDVWAVFEQISGEPLKKCTGIYRDPEKDNASIEQKMLEALTAALGGKFQDIPTMEVTEYSTTEYSQETLKLVEVGREGRYGIYWLSQAEMEELLLKKPQAQDWSDVWRNHTGGKNGVSGMRRKSIDQKRRTDNESENNKRNRVHMGADRGDPGSR